MLQVLKTSYHIITLFFITAIAFSSCTETKTAGKLRGKFFSKTFLDEIPTSVIGQVKVYCYELDFMDNDSVAISYGFERDTLLVKKDGNSYLLSNGVQGDVINVTLNKNGSLILQDSVWTGEKRNSVFFKVDEKDSLNHFINEKVIAGKYLIYEKGKATNKNVEFKVNGKVTGLQDFENYSICYSGDCTQETLTPANTITFNGKEKSVSYAFEIDSQNEIVHICNLEQPIHDIKGERKVLNKIYDLKRINTN